MATKEIRFDGWVLDPESGDLRRPGVRTRLQEQLVLLLKELVAHAGNVVTREHLIGILWPKGVVDFDTGLNTAVRKLRNALGDTADTPRYIETLPRRGYRFIAALEPDPEAFSVTSPSGTVPVSHAYGAAVASATPSYPEPTALREAALAGAEPTANTDERTSRDEAPVSTVMAAARRLLIPALPLIAALAVAGLLIGVYAIWKTGTGHINRVHVQVPSQTGLSAKLTFPRAVPFAPPPNSIAVLPLANESGDAGQQYFSDGISEDLITALSQFPALKVIGRTSAFQFRDSKEDSRGIGAKLGVAHLLEGSVRRAGELVRVNAELIDTGDGSTEWSARYDRPYKDLFALQDEITGAVVEALRAKLLPGEHAAAQSERPPGGSLKAYNALLQGRFYLLRQTEADYRKAIEFFTQATQIDPRYALAWSGLSEAWVALAAGFLGSAEAQAAYAKAREAADRALILSPELAAAHIARGGLLQLADFDWRRAEAEFRRALELAPNDGKAKFYLGSQLAIVGDVESAIELTRQALATEPLRPNWYSALAAYLSALNRLDEAEGAVRRAIDLEPAATAYHHMLTIIEIQRGHAPAALATAQQESPGVWRDAALALARQIGGERSAADAALGTLIEKDANDGAFQIAQVYALRNDDKKTFEWLELAWSHRDPGISGLLFDPLILRYKDDPRFAGFCRKVDLPLPRDVPGRKPS